MMRLASILLVLVLMTSSVVGGTFAKYTTSVSDSDEARVAKWGFTQTSITLDDLFAKTYTLTAKGNQGNDGDSVVSSESGVDVIAPGTTGSAKFGFAFGGEGTSAPEVDYTFVVSTEDSVCDDKIKANTNIQWKLDSKEWGTWDQMIADIQALDGEEFFDAGELPTGFKEVGNNEHTISWQWIFETADDASTTDKNEMDIQDKIDTEMGNMTELDDVKLVIKITATQVD